MGEEEGSDNDREEALEAVEQSGEGDPCEQLFCLSKAGQRINLLEERDALLCGLRRGRIPRRVCHHSQRSMETRYSLKRYRLRAVEVRNESRGV